MAGVVLGGLAPAHATVVATTGNQPEVVGILNCDGPVYANGRLEGSEGGGATPEQALKAFDRGPARPLPVNGYQALERSAETVLFAYRNEGRIRAAVKVAKKRNARTVDGSVPRDAWTFTSFAGCDPAEFAPSADDEIGIGLVRQSDGTRLPARLIHQRPATPHCFPGVSSLFLGQTLPTYVRDPQHEVASELLVPFESDTTLPSVAADTGLRTGEFALFAGPDARAIYAVGPDRVERWPARVPKPARACG
ncbi:MAG: hypothetical protein ACT4QG_12430 [Sporichthyaceae bacterium]